MDQPTREQLIQQHLDAIRTLQAVPAATGESAPWPPQGYYLLWHVVIGMMLGGIGAAVSLAGNVIFAPLFGQPALQLIRVYLTFPMGEAALQAEQGVVLFLGCLLYLVTGALYGVLFHIVMTVWLRTASAGKRFMTASLIGLGLWVVNFYLVLSWLQPMLLGGNWIVQMVPFWVAALTHLAFAWTMWLIDSWGEFDTHGH